MNIESHSLWTLLSLLILLIRDSAAPTPYQDLAISASCPGSCGDIPIPYPFGIGEDCYRNKWFEIVCNETVSGKFSPFLPGIGKEVVNISLFLDDHNRYSYDQVASYGLSARVKSPITSSGCTSGGELSGTLINLTGSPFFVGEGNRLVTVGCSSKAWMTNVKPSIVGCETNCDARNLALGRYRDENGAGCNGYRCCEARTPRQLLQVIGVRIENNNGGTTEGCRVAFLTDQTYYSSNISEPQVFHHNDFTTLELRWLIDDEKDLPTDCSISYGPIDQSSITTAKCSCYYQSRISYASCRCNKGYRGNPYLSRGCKDIDECLEGRYCIDGHCVNTVGGYTCTGGYKKVYSYAPLIAASFSFCLVIVGGTYWLYKFIKRRNTINRKKKFFKRNGGLLLQQQLTSTTEGNVEKTKIFSSKELEKATEHFSTDRVLGQGGQGTVYKGMLLDGRIIAVKKSKAVDEDKLEEFINEVVILSQINHRNIVKLLGCCLETDVPLLVYEFIPNGNLFEHLHDGSDDYTMTWEERLRIAIEIAGALSYLHSAASCPVFHRDIKSSNILLDEKYRSKVSDFGTSRSVSIDQTHVTTLVAGTFGYLDPEYFQSSRFTDKSDVYSFGVVLAELITGEKPVSEVRSEENRGLAAHFIEAMKENRLHDMVDGRIKEHYKLEQVMAVAKLARKCLNLKGKKRPSMREVSMELERIRSSPPGDPFLVNNIEEDEEDEVMRVDIGDSWNVVFSAPSAEFVAASSSSTDVEPLFPHKTQ